MPLEPVASDTPLWGIVFAAVNGLYIAALGWFHVRTSGIEKKVDTIATSARHEREQGDKDIWTALESDRKLAATYRENVLARMVTKGDMAQAEARQEAMERRLMEAIQTMFSADMRLQRRLATKLHTQPEE